MEEHHEEHDSTQPLHSTAHRLQLQQLHADSPSPDAAPTHPETFHGASAAAAPQPSGAASSTNGSKMASLKEEDDSMLRLAALLTAANQGPQEPSTAAAPLQAAASAAANGRAPPAATTGLAALQAVGVSAGGASPTSSAPAAPPAAAGLRPAPLQATPAAGGPTCHAEGLTPGGGMAAVGPLTPAQHQAATVSQLLEASPAAPGPAPQPLAGGAAPAEAALPVKVKWARKLGPGGEPKSQLKGVFWDCKTGRWRSQLGYNHRKLFMGYFENAEDAAVAYDCKAVELHGFNAKTNYPLENYWHLLSQRPEAAALTAAATGAGLGGEGGEGATEALQLLQQDVLQEMLGSGDSGERLPRGSKRRAAVARSRWMQDLQDSGGEEGGGAPHKHGEDDPEASLSTLDEREEDEELDLGSDAGGGPRRKRRAIQAFTQPEDAAGGSSTAGRPPAGDGDEDMLEAAQQLHGMGSVDLYAAQALRELGMGLVGAAVAGAAGGGGVSSGRGGRGAAATSGGDAGGGASGGALKPASKLSPLAPPPAVVQLLRRAQHGIPKQGAYQKRDAQGRFKPLYPKQEATEVPTGSGGRSRRGKGRANAPAGASPAAAAAGGGAGGSGGGATSSDGGGDRCPPAAAPVGRRWTVPPRGPAQGPREGLFAAAAPSGGLPGLPHLPSAEAPAWGVGSATNSWQEASLYPPPGPFPPYPAPVGGLPSAWGQAPGYPPPMGPWAGRQQYSQQQQYGPGQPWGPSQQYNPVVDQLLGALGGPVARQHHQQLHPPQGLALNQPPAGSSLGAALLAAGAQVRQEPAAATATAGGDPPQADLEALLLTLLEMVRSSKRATPGPEGPAPGAATTTAAPVPVHPLGGRSSSGGRGWEDAAWGLRRSATIPWVDRQEAELQVDHRAHENDNTPRYRRTSQQLQQQPVGGMSIQPHQGAAGAAPTTAADAGMDQAGAGGDEALAAAAALVLHSLEQQAGGSGGRGDLQQVQQALSQLLGQQAAGGVSEQLQQKKADGGGAVMEAEGMAEEGAAAAAAGPGADAEERPQQMGVNTARAGNQGEASKGPSCAGMLPDGDQLGGVGAGPVTDSFLRRHLERQRAREQREMQAWQQQRVQQQQGLNELQQEQLGYAVQVSAAPLGAQWGMGAAWGGAQEAAVGGSTAANSSTARLPPGLQQLYEGLAHHGPGNPQMSGSALNHPWGDSSYLHSNSAADPQAGGAFPRGRSAAGSGSGGTGHLFGLPAGAWGLVSPGAAVQPRLAPTDGGDLMTYPGAGQAGRGLKGRPWQDAAGRPLQGSLPGPSSSSRPAGLPSQGGSLGAAAASAGGRAGQVKGRWPQRSVPIYPGSQRQNGQQGANNKDSLGGRLKPGSSSGGGGVGVGEHSTAAGGAVEEGPGLQQQARAGGAGGAGASQAASLAPGGLPAHQDPAQQPAEGVGGVPGSTEGGQDQGGSCGVRRQVPSGNTRMVADTNGTDAAASLIGDMSVEQLLQAHQLLSAGGAAAAPADAARAQAEEEAGLLVQQLKQLVASKLQQHAGSAAAAQDHGGAGS